MSLSTTVISIKQNILKAMPFLHFFRKCFAGQIKEKNQLNNLCSNQKNLACPFQSRLNAAHNSIEIVV